MTQPLPNLPFGTDLATITASNGVGDLDVGMAEVTGRTLLAQRLARRLTTPRGSVIDAPNDCVDIRLFMSTVSTPQGISATQGSVQNELQKDQGVLSATVAVAYSIQTSIMSITIQVQSAYGPFSLTLAVSAVTISILVNGQPLSIA